MSEKDDVLILAIESSCDETAAAVVKNGREVLSNVINTQIAIHTEYGGVVPEIASRKHIENINPVIRKALEDAGVTLDDIDAIGVTYGPGLVGALLVGVGRGGRRLSHFLCCHWFILLFLLLYLKIFCQISLQSRP